MRAIPYCPPAGQHTAGAEKRAAERALDRLMTENPDAAHAQLTQPTKPPQAFVEAYADELTRAPLPSRRQRRAMRPRAAVKRSYARNLVESGAEQAQQRRLDRMRTDPTFFATQAAKRATADARRARRGR